MQHLRSLLCLIVLMAVSLPAPANPSTQFVVTLPGGTKSVGLNDYVRFSFNGDEDLTCDDITLLLDSKPGIAADCKVVGDRELAFHLQRDQSNRSYWAELLGSPFSGKDEKPLSVLLKIGNRVLIAEQSKPMNKATSSAPPSGAAATTSAPAASGAAATVSAAASGAAAAPESQTAIESKQKPKEVFIVLRRYSRTLVFCASICVIVILLLTVFGVYQGFGRDGCIPQMRVKELPFSLGRCQMALWFGLSFAAFCFMYVLIRDTNTLNSESLTLMGISSGTALVAIAIDRTKDETSRIEQAVTDLGLSSRWHVELLHDITHPTKPHRRINGWRILGKLFQGYQPDLLRRPSPLPKSDDPVDATVFPISALNGTIKTYAKLWERYEATIDPLCSRGFLSDLVTDVNGPTIARWQIVVWTLALAVIYVANTYSTLELPVFGPTLLSLMGISSGVYLGFKVPETQVPKEQAENPNGAAENLPPVKPSPGALADAVVAKAGGGPAKGGGPADDGGAGEGGVGPGGQPA